MKSCSEVPRYMTLTAEKCLVPDLTWLLTTMNRFKKMLAKLLYTFLPFIFLTSPYVWCEEVKDQQVDELLSLSSVAIAQKRFDDAWDILIRIENSKSNITYSQNVNLLKGKIELAYILKIEENLVENVLELYQLTDGNEHYEKFKNRLVHRVCYSEDWSMYRDIHINFCESIRTNSGYANPQPEL
ncbi:hypothetical protein Rhein_2368 [Rheinheimera sp. A13L]|uniref:hypothetical protein n=1 Tax=Rheinheimera sp. A13L TaxID=506534 RepID=UPI0002125012|nr:hypothetical protein [Rheinheimera sp. A13L]EGM77563.1 hypothetical protein Rhein_2368 [Rheinheimera sp. A13L]